MEVIGRVTGGLAHDFNNLPPAIVGNLDLIRRRTTEQTVRKCADSGYADSAVLRSAVDEASLPPLI